MLRTTPISLASLLTIGLPLACASNSKSPASAQDVSPIAAPPVPVEPEVPAAPEVIATGNDCTTAKGSCEGGVCSVDVTNRCEVAVTCELTAMSVCRADTTSGEARGKGRNTVPARETVQIQAQGDRVSARVVATQLVGLRCR